jgi:D-cysteine desulfhydrase
LGDLPTPVERAPWLDDGRREVWIKRDDLSSEIYGGGKVRKLEWALANSPFDGPQPITSVGGIGSNHLVALALFLRELDRHLHAVVFSQPPTDHVRTNLAIMASMGASFWFVPHRWQLPGAWARHAFGRQRDLGPMMAPGASTPLGCFGFVEAGLELAQQIEDGELPKPQTIFITGGTGGASAGLALGLAMAGISTHLHIVSAVEPVLYNRWLMAAKLRHVHQALRAHGWQGSTSASVLLRSAGVTWTLDHRQVGDGYGAPTPAGRSAGVLAARNGLELDPTYTTKCVAGLRAAPVSGPVLFWNTHGSNDLRARMDENWQARLPPRLARHVQTTWSETSTL